MIINFSPIRGDQPLNLLRKGAILTLNGQMIDLETYVTGQNDLISGQPAHDGVQWLVNLLLPHGAQAGQETLFPAPCHLTEDGPVILPPFEVLPDEDAIDLV